MQAISGLRLHLLGRFTAFPSGAPDQPLSISSRKGCALLAYLAMQPPPAPTLKREQLATLLWGDRFDKQARQSLRQTILSLRQQLEPIAPGLLVLDGELIGLDAESFSTDAREFAALAEEVGDPERALGLYRGEFLAGFNLDVEPFDEWVRGERARFAAIAARLLELQAERSDERGDGDQALRACERLLAIEPQREDWQRLTLTLTAQHRGREAALARAKVLIGLLRKEFDADPEPGTAALINDIRRGALKRKHDAEPGAGTVSAEARIALHPVTAQLPFPDRPSIAVLAFANLSGDKEQEYLSDGITEDIITELSRFSELFVIARNSSFQYKGKAIDVRQVGRDLGVRYVLEGSLRRGGDRLRISAQLIDATTGLHRWAERYDRKLEEVFAVQDEIVHAIAAIIAAHVRKAETERTRAKPPNSWQVYDCCLRALDASNALTTSLNVADLHEARRFLQLSLSIDANCARSHTLLARTYVAGWMFPLNSEFLDPRVLDQAYQLARKAVQLDPNLPAARSTLCGVLTLQGRHEASIAEFERAITLNPNYLEFSFGAALLHAGHPKRAIDVLEACMRLDPIYTPSITVYLGFAHYMLQQYEQALIVLRECVSLAPNFRSGHVLLAATYARLDQLDEARAEAAEVLRIQPSYTISGTARLMAPFKQPEDDKHFCDGLREAGLPE